VKIQQKKKIGKQYALAVSGRVVVLLALSHDGKTAFVETKDFYGRGSKETVPANSLTPVKKEAA